MRALRFASTLSVFFSLFLGSLPAPAKEAVPFCKPEALQAVQRQPQLQELPQEERASMDLPATDPLQKKRKAQIAGLIAQYAAWANEAWWKSSPAELLACKIRQQTGPLSAEEAQRYKEEAAWIQGDDSLRLLSEADPFFFDGNNGVTNAFLFVRAAGKSRVSLLIDRYLSRADQPLSFSSTASAPRILGIEAASGGMSPSLELFAFKLDDALGKAEAYPIFPSEKGGLSNHFWISTPLDIWNVKGLPSPALIQNSKLVPKIPIYELDGDSYLLKFLEWDGSKYALAPKVHKKFKSIY